MRRATLPFFALLAALSARAGEPEWTAEAERAARGWYAERLKEEKPGLEVESLRPVDMRGPGADVVGPRLRLFDARAVKNRDGVFAWEARRIAVRRDLKPWRWEGSLEDMRVLLAECGVETTGEKGMQEAAMAVMAVSEGPAFDSARVEISGRMLTYHDHRAVGYFGCGFAGWWYGDATLKFGEDGRLEAFDAAKSTMRYQEYREKSKSLDPWFVDEVHGGMSNESSVEEKKRRRADLLASLVGDDETNAAAAEREISRWGAAAGPFLTNASAGASPAALARIARVRRWIAPDWAKEADEEARRAYEAQLPVVQDAWVLKEFSLIPLIDAAEPLAWAWRLYRAQCASKSGVQAKHDLVFVAKDGVLLPWSGDLLQARELLDRAGVRSEGDESTSRAVAALAALPTGAYRTTKVNAVEPERIEVRGRNALWHEHRMWLGSGVVGGYTEDIEYIFGEDGLLSEIRTGRIEDFDVREMERLLAEADPWMKLEGWVPEEMAASLKKAQAKKQKAPPRHGEPK